MADREHRLTTLEMAGFVARGLVRFDAVVPAELNERFMAEAKAGPPAASPAGTPLSACYEKSVVSEILLDEECAPKEGDEE